LAEREPELRVAARAVVLGPDDRILLVFFRNPYTGATWWATPGGAVDPGETHEEGLRRELREEAGIDAAAGPFVWTRVSEYEWGARFIRQVEQYYLIRVGSFDLNPELDLAAEDVHDLRWWSLDEIAASDEVFAPRRLAELVRDLLEHGPPAKPIDAGV
jgi:8-oxo-dGTP pyrophosphatase MutT (NUDIX family)